MPNTFETIAPSQSNKNDIFINWTKHANQFNIIQQDKKEREKSSVNL